MDARGAEASTEQRFRVGWGDLDANQHLGNRAILDRAADARLLWFAANGFPGPRLAAERFGPAIVRDELVYRRELRLLDEFTVDVLLTGLSDDAVRFAVQNTFRNAEREVTTVVRSEGVWFDLDRRRPRRPPAELEAIFRAMPRSTDYAELPSRRIPSPRTGSDVSGPSPSPVT
jgi:acyl-CoA thioester hydrolase